MLPTWLFWRLVKADRKDQINQQQRNMQSFALGMGNYDEKGRKEIFAAWDTELETNKWKPRINRNAVRRQVRALEKLGVKIPKHLRDKAG